MILIFFSSLSFHIDEYGREWAFVFVIVELGAFPSGGIGKGDYIK